VLSRNTVHVGELAWDWDRGDSRDVGLEAAIISKVRNSLPAEPSRAENDGDSSVVPQSRIREIE